MERAKQATPDAEYPHLTNGRAGSSRPVLDPSTGATLYTLTSATEEECHAAMTRARSAAMILRQTSMAVRVEAMDALINFLKREQDWLLDHVVAESGRCRGDAMLSDVLQLLGDCLWLRRNADASLRDEQVPTPASLEQKHCRILHEPRGVVLVIAPWNLPLAIGMTAAMFAFMAGNAVVLKPSEHTPMVPVFDRIRSLHPLFKLALEVVHGGASTGVDLIAERPDFICFTGSVATGKRILAQAAPMVIPVMVELGAKDAMLVWDDADLTRAVGAACWGNLHNSGQSCTGTERIFVHASVYTDFVKRLVAASLRIRMGTGPDSDLGAIATQFQINHIDALVQDARSKGARVLCGGQRSECGRYYAPTVISGTTRSMRIDREEIFVPVVTVSPFENEAEAIDLHNSMPFGLSTSLWTQDAARAERLTRALDVGCVNVNNVMLTEANVWLPFGGVKYSGFGRMKGVEGLRGMTRSKAVMIDASRAQAEPNWYPYSAAKLRQLQERLTRRSQRRLLSSLWRLQRHIRAKIHA